MFIKNRSLNRAEDAQHTIERRGVSHTNYLKEEDGFEREIPDPVKINQEPTTENQDAYNHDGKHPLYMDLDGNFYSGDKETGSVEFPSEDKTTTTMQTMDDPKILKDLKSVWVDPQGGVFEEIDGELVKTDRVVTNLERYLPHTEESVDSEVFDPDLHHESIEKFRNDLSEAMPSIGKAIAGLFFSGKEVEQETLDPKISILEPSESKSETKEAVFEFGQTIKFGDKSITVKLKVRLTNYDKLEDWLKTQKDPEIEPNPEQELTVADYKNQLEDRGFSLSDELEDGWSKYELDALDLNETCYINESGTIYRHRTLTKMGETDHWEIGTVSKLEDFKSVDAPPVDLPEVIRQDAYKHSAAQFEGIKTNKDGFLIDHKKKPIELEGKPIYFQVSDSDKLPKKGEYFIARLTTDEKGIPSSIITSKDGSVEYNHYSSDNLEYGIGFRNSLKKETPMVQLIDSENRTHFFYRTDDFEKNGRYFVHEDGHLVRTRDDSGMWSGDIRYPNEIKPLIHDGHKISPDGFLLNEDNSLFHVDGKKVALEGYGLDPISAEEENYLIAKETDPGSYYLTTGKIFEPAPERLTVNDLAGKNFVSEPQDQSFQDTWPIGGGNQGYLKFSDNNRVEWRFPGSDILESESYTISDDNSIDVQHGWQGLEHTLSLTENNTIIWGNVEYRLQESPTHNPWD